MGLGAHSLVPHLIDFGISKQLDHSETRVHAPIRRVHGLVGTPAFASINNHLGSELSRRDDLESLVYVLIYLSRGSLPWLQRARPNKRRSRDSRQAKALTILTSKQVTPVEQLCGNTRELSTLSTMLIYTRMLSYSEAPDYDYLRSLLSAVLVEQLSADGLQIIKNDLSSSISNGSHSPSVSVRAPPSPAQAAQYFSPVPRRPRQVPMSINYGSDTSLAQSLIAV